MSSRQVDDRLTVREEPDAYFVVLEHDESDWVVAFDKAPDFAAREWAMNMAESYNDRLADPARAQIAGGALPPT